MSSFLNVYFKLSESFVQFLGWERRDVSIRYITLSLKKSKSVSLDLADFFLGTLKDPKGSHKKNQIRNAIFRVPRYPQTLPVFELSGTSL